MVIAEISVTLDGYVAGPNATLESPLGDGGERIHEWLVATRAWRERHGMEGGVEGDDDALARASVERTGATIMGRRMFSGGAGAWSDDPNPDGWWGDDPPFHGPVFVLTHHARPAEQKHGGTTYTFVTDGIASALEQAEAASRGRDVAVVGGARTIQQFLESGLVDELHLHLVPLLLGGGVRLFDGVDAVELELVRAVSSAAVTHLTYRPT